MELYVWVWVIIVIQMYPTFMIYNQYFEYMINQHLHLIDLLSWFSQTHEYKYGAL